MKYKIKTLIFALTMLISTIGFSQVATQPVQPPWFYYWPSENADNFEYSELGNSSLSGGNTFQRKSNIEVNKRAEQPEIPSAPEAVDNETVIDTEVGIVDSGISSRPASSSSLYKWVDKDGIVHVTNEPGTIPEEYRDQIGN